MSETQEQIEAYNRRELLNDAIGNVEAAIHGLEQAQGALEDLGFSDMGDSLEARELPRLRLLVDVLKVHRG